MNAESREQVFAALREKGIKAIKVVAADGSKANGEIRGVRKRVAACIAFLAAAASVGAFYFLVPSANRWAQSAEEFLTSSMRRQVIGDVAVVEKGIRTGWSDVFELEGERYLASFSVPGYPPAVSRVSEEKFKEALASPPRTSDSSGAQLSLEARQIVAMVEGLKDEARRFISKGGSVAQYCRLLVRRQEEELGYYNRAKGEVEKAFDDSLPKGEIEELWENRNDSLRALGIRPIPYPSDE